MAGRDAGLRISHGLREQRFDADNRLRVAHLLEVRAFEQPPRNRFEALKVFTLQLVPGNALVLEQCAVVALLPALLAQPAHETERAHEQRHRQQQNEKNALLKLHGGRSAWVGSPAKGQRQPAPDNPPL